MFRAVIEKTKAVLFHRLAWTDERAKAPTVQVEKQLLHKYTANRKVFQIKARQCQRAQMVSHVTSALPHDADEY
jgi:hypothetical protein